MANDSDLPLIGARSLVCNFAILAIFCTVVTFFFPVVCGPFSVVHGPMTALCAVRERIRIWLLMALAALHTLGYRHPISSLSFVSSVEHCNSPQHSTQGISVLRC